MSKQIFTIMKLKEKDYLDLYKQFPNIKKEDLENSGGFADREEGEIYIRKSGDKEMDNAMILHEAEELFKETSPHEKGGIRFGFGSWFKKTFIPESKGSKGGVLGTLAALALAPFTGGASLAYMPLAGAAGGAIGGSQEGDILGGALKGLGAGTLGTAGVGAFQGATKAASGLLSKAGGAVSGAGKALGLPGFGKGGKLSALGTAKVAPMTGAIKSASGSLYGGAAPSTGYTPGGISAGVSPTAGAGINAAALGRTAMAPMNAPPSVTRLSGGQAPAGGALQVGGPVGPAPYPVGSYGARGLAAPGGAAEVAKAAPTTLWEKAKGLITPQNILGAGSLMGSMVPTAPEFQMPSTVEDLRKKLLEQTEGGPGGLTEIGQQAQLELGNILKSTPQELYPTANDAYYDAALRRTRESYQVAQENMDKAYNLAGTYGSGEHMAQKAKLQEELARTESGLQAETEQRRFELARTEKYQAIQDSLGVDRNVMDDLVGLSGLDVQTAAMIYGAQAADVQSIREALGTLGAELLVRGTTGSGTQPAININTGSLGE